MKIFEASQNEGSTHPRDSLANRRSRRAIFSWRERGCGEVFTRGTELADPLATGPVLASAGRQVCCRLPFARSSPGGETLPRPPDLPTWTHCAHIWLPFACSQARLVPQTAFYPESETFFEPTLGSRTMGPLDCRRKKNQVRPAHGLARRGAASTSGIILKTIDLSRCDCPASRTCAFLSAPALVIGSQTTGRVSLESGLRPRAYVARPPTS